MSMIAPKQNIPVVNRKALRTRRHPKHLVSGCAITQPMTLTTPKSTVFKYTFPAKSPTLSVNPKYTILQGIKMILKFYNK